MLTNPTNDGRGLFQSQCVSCASGSGRLPKYDSQLFPSSFDYSSGMPEYYLDSYGLAIPPCAISLLGSVSPGIHSRMAKPPCVPVLEYLTTLPLPYIYMNTMSKLLSQFLNLCCRR